MPELVKISEMTAIAGASVSPASDLVALVDTSAAETKKIAVSELFRVYENDELKAWTNSGAFAITSATRDSDGVITTATVAWPDGSAGTFTRTTKNAIWLVIDAYTVTHSASGKTVTQAAVTRDSNGNITAQPSLTVA